MAEAIKITSAFWHGTPKKRKKKKRLFPIERKPTDDHIENIKILKQQSSTKKEAIK